MAARVTRQEARQKVIDSFMASLDKVIPPEESAPLKGRTFLDWEKQAEQLKRAVIPTLLEERAALELVRSPRAGVENKLWFAEVYGVRLRRDAVWILRRSIPHPRRWPLAFSRIVQFGGKRIRNVVR